MGRTRGIGLAVAAPFLLIGTLMIVGWAIDGRDVEMGWLFLAMGIAFLVFGLLPLRMAFGGGALGRMLAGYEAEDAAARRVEALRAAGRHGTATVTSVVDTGVSRPHEHRLTVGVTIEPDGGGSYDSEVTRMFPVIALPRIGERYAVFVDPADAHRWLLDAARPLRSS